MKSCSAETEVDGGDADALAGGDSSKENRPQPKRVLEASGSRAAPSAQGVKAQKASPKLLFIANVAWFFRSHRLPLALAALARGYEVHLASAFASEQEEQRFRSEGIHTHRISFERSGTALSSELHVIRELWGLLRALRPSLCHNVTIKPVIYGGVLARALHIPYVSAISGLGYSYIAKGLRAHLRRNVLSAAYRFAVSGKRSRVIVQNADDLAFFKNDLRIDDEMLTLIRGSGVDLGQFDPSMVPAEPTVAVLPARMLVDKGVYEFVAAARDLKRKGIKARFALVGGLDKENRAGLTEEDLTSITADGAVEYWGQRSDMSEVLAAARIVCLPSYREGLPKALLEAGAAGRAIVTTDVPGCRETVVHEVNGLLVPARDSAALAQALERLILDPKLCGQMGARGRAMVEENFSLQQVVERTMRLYQELLP